ncbi:MAG: DUF1501 domain-containing protein [Polyangiaceae bacterium]
MSGFESSRRSFLKAALAGTVGASTFLQKEVPSFADAAATSDEFFVVVLLQGGWDVMLLTDPRNEKKGLVAPPTTETTDLATTKIRHWTDAPFDGDVKTFAPVKPHANAAMRLGPAIGDLAAYYDRLTIVNGLAMSTVSHPDGVAFSTTGRHLGGGQPASATIDTMLASEFGRAQLIPSAAIGFPSVFLGNHLDRRAVPLKIPSLATVSRTLTRSTRFETAAERTRVTRMLAAEADDLAKGAARPTTFESWGAQLRSLESMLDRDRGDLRTLFDVTALQAAYPDLHEPYADPVYGAATAAQKKAKFFGAAPTNFAFAIESMRRDVLRTVSLTMGNFDTHFASNYRIHAALLQESMNLLAGFLRELDRTPHPTRAGKKLADHTHVLVVSDFCRSPGINLSGGRDHHPNNSAIVISPKWKGNRVIGSTDTEQVLPKIAGTFTDGARPIAPPDVLATMLASVDVDPRRYMRDGEVVPGVIA